MKRSELISALVDASGCSKKQVTRVLDGLAETVTGHLKQPGDDFTLPGIGKWRLAERTQRTAEDAADAPARLTVRFSATGKLREAISKKPKEAAAPKPRRRRFGFG